MAAFNIPVQLSPGVNVTEIDLSAIVPSVATTTGAFAGNFEWGPANQVVTVSSENELVQTFGKPSATDSARAIDFYCALNFLSYGANLRIVRYVAASNAASKETNANKLNTNGLIVRNREDWESNTSLNTSSTQTIIAKYPGILGNSLKVVVMDNDPVEGLSLSGPVAYGSTLIEFGSTFNGEIGDSIIFGEQGNYQRFTVSGISGNNAVKVVPPVGFVLPPGIVASSKSKYSEYFLYPPTVSEDAQEAGGANDELNVVVVDKDGVFTGQKGGILETFNNVSKANNAKTANGGSNYFYDVINDTSSYIWVSSALCGVTSANLPKTTQFGTIATSGTGARPGVIVSTLSGGTAGQNNDDYAYLNGYAKFDDKETVDISLMITGRADIPLARNIVSICESRQDSVAFVSPALTTVVNKTNAVATADLKSYRNSLNINSSYAFMDSGWKYMYDKYNDRFIWVPLNPDVAGLCARTDAQFDAWYSPAGFNRGQIKGVVKLAYNPTKGNRDEIYPVGINPVANFPGEGVVLFGDKTMQVKASAFDRLGVRRLFIVLEKAISLAAKFQLFELNDALTRSTFVNLVVPYLKDVQARRGIIDFKVVCDTTNNTGQVIDNNQFVADIFIKPTRSINYIQLNFIATRTDASFDIIGA
jgi:phage tail sheath protein FI